MKINKSIQMHIKILNLLSYLSSPIYHCQEEDMYVFLGIDIFEHEIFKYYTKRNELDVAILSFVF